MNTPVQCHPRDLSKRRPFARRLLSDPALLLVGATRIVGEPLHLYRPARRCRPYFSSVF